MTKASEPQSTDTEPVKGALLSGSVTSALRQMAVPMLFGMVAMITVNLIDTYWVSRLGTEALAAMSFTFPVEALVINVSLGLMVGTSVVVSQSVGSGNADQARRLTTDATVLALGVVAIVSTLGLLFQDQLFGLLGAKGRMLTDVKSYMTPWFIGVGFLVVPMIANGALRALGDAKTPMRVMMLGAAVNAVLDPVLIFGWGPVPKLGLQGAALATVAARFIAMLVVFYILIRRTQLLDFRGITWNAMLNSWKRLGQVAVPAIVTNAVGPLAVGVLTGMVALHGSDALAAWGIGARIDAVLLLFPFALSGAVSPFVGQNYGAHLRARVSEGLRKSMFFALGWGALAAAVIMIFAPTLAAQFSSEAGVQDELRRYLRIVPVGYAFIGSVAICSSAFNAVDRATRSTLLSVLRSLVIAIPAAMLGNTFAGLTGLFFGLVAASIVSAILGAFWMRSFLSPYGTRPAQAKPMTDADVADWFDAHPDWAALKSGMPTVLELERLKPHLIRGGALGFHIGAFELAHLDEHGVLDLPLPVEIGANLVKLGALAPHPNLDNNGWYRFQLSDSCPAETAAWLIGLAHLLHQLSERGESDPITQQEMDTYTTTPHCVAAMRQAAMRWNAAGNYTDTP